MESKLLELDLDEINEHHAAYERAHARLVVLAIGLGIGLVIALVAVPILLWPRTSARIDPASTWPLAALAALWIGMTIAAYLQRQRAFRRVRQGCLKLRRAGYRIRKQDVYFSGSVFGISEFANGPNAGDRSNVVDINRVSARTLHTMMN